jgi:hypothetical protein
MNQRRATHA